MYNPNAEIVTLLEIQNAKTKIFENSNIVRTPMLKDVSKIFLKPEQQNVHLHMKLENMQVAGSFKVRGVLNQLLNLPSGYGTKEKKLISMSAGNYGRTFAYMTNKMHLSGVILMPLTAPDNRAKVIEEYGVEVRRYPTSQLQTEVDNYVKENNALYLHSFDDARLITGHGLEILEDVSEPDVILVCCGGGGVLSGVAAAIRLSGNSKCRIYGVEPEGACTMYESYIQNKPVSMNVSTVASGLAPPFAGSNTFRHCKAFVNGILLVSDKEILSAMFHLYRHGLLVEPSGSAAFAALYHGKVPDVDGKQVVVVVTGGNVTPEELEKHSNSMEEDV